MCMFVLYSINDKLKKFLVEDVYFFTQRVALLNSIFDDKCDKERLFLCYVVVGNNITFVFDLT